MQQQINRRLLLSAQCSNKKIGDYCFLHNAAAKKLAIVVSCTMREPESEKKWGLGESLYFYLLLIHLNNGNTCSAHFYLFVAERFHKRYRGQVFPDHVA
jgi:hypothetical protein